MNMNEMFLAQPKFSWLTPEKCCIESFEICENIYLVIFTNIHLFGHSFSMIFKNSFEKMNFLYFGSGSWKRTGLCRIQWRINSVWAYIFQIFFFIFDKRNGWALYSDSIMVNSTEGNWPSLSSIVYTGCTVRAKPLSAKKTT